MAWHDEAMFFQLGLEPRDIRWRDFETLTIACDELGVGPRDQAGIGKAFPGKERTGIGFALRSDIAVPHDAMRCDLMPFRDIADEFDHGIDLFIWEGFVGAIAISRVSAVDDLDADGARVELGLAEPAATPRMPGETAFLHQSINRRRFDVDEIVAADSAPRQNLERVTEVEVRVVQNDETRSALVIEALVAGVDARLLEGCHTT